jgi:predicted enzyme related to lactoylglutathione lyase
MGHDRHIDYVEFCAPDLPAVKKFYGQVFGWEFQDWGPDYIDFKGAGLAGGFRREEVPMAGGTLVIMYAHSLGDTLVRVEEAGGTISRPIFDFPGGRRFHFLDPCGNELGVWSDK